MESQIILKDGRGEEIKIDDIVKSINKFDKDPQIQYYLYSYNDNSQLYLIRYDSNGNLEKDGLLNIHIDAGIKLINNSQWGWERIGRREEVYSNLFKS